MSRLTVATFNVRYGTAADGPDHWEHRWPVFGDVVAALGADVLCLQEALTFQLAHAHHVLPGFRSVGVCRTNGQVGTGGGEMVPVLWRADRLELVDAGHFWLSPEPHLPGRIGWDAAHPRMATWAALRFAARPAALFHVINTHLDYRGPVSREEGARLIARRVAALGPHVPVLVTGNFNGAEDGPPYAVFRAAGFADAYRVAHPDRDPAVEGTFHQFTGSRLGERVDWVLASPHWHVRGCRIDHSTRDGRFPSDHFPVVADLELGE